MSLPLSGQAFPCTSWVDTAKASPIIMREKKEEVSGNSSQVCPEEVFRAWSVVNLSSGLHWNEVSSDKSHIHWFLHCSNSTEKETSSRSASYTLTFSLYFPRSQKTRYTGQLLHSFFFFWEMMDVLFRSITETAVLSKTAAWYLAADIGQTQHHRESCKKLFRMYYKVRRLKQKLLPGPFLFPSSLRFSHTLSHRY